ncbi:hypothetical protein FOA52_010374 [Chlamydomonas sp. UWO 241]|nr:hypothetical protein FOA52_010374 [Chlamydomonas sp. UWO 241]
MPPMRKGQDDRPLLEGRVGVWEKRECPYVVGTVNEDVRLALTKWVKTDAVAPPLDGPRHPHLKPVPTPERAPAPAPPPAPAEPAAPGEAAGPSAMQEDAQPAVTTAPGSSAQLPAAAIANAGVSGAGAAGAARPPPAGPGAADAMDVDRSGGAHNPVGAAGGAQSAAAVGSLRQS